MSSESLYIIIVGIWALVLLPTWLRKQDANERIRTVQGFKKAMEKLGEGLPLIQPGLVEPSVTAKRAVKTGLDLSHKQRLSRRRRVFVASVTTVPSTIAAVAFGGLSTAALALPVVALTGYILWARHDVQVEVLERRASRTQVRRPSAPAQRSHLAAGLAAIRRVALERLLAADPVIRTEETQSWVAADSSRTFSLPDQVVPTYVSAPAATAVPREIDRVHGSWGAEEMLAAVERQRRQEELARLVAETSASQQSMPKPVVRFDDEDTQEITRVS